MISIVPLLTDLKLRLMHSFEVKSVRHPTFAPEGVAGRTLTIAERAPWLSTSTGGDEPSRPINVAIFTVNERIVAMADDRAIRGPQDRQRVNMSEDCEVAYWSKKWGITREEVAEAVSRAGPMSAAVARQLGKEA
jgi:hypothetical protein